MDVFYVTIPCNCLKMKADNHGGVKMHLAKQEVFQLLSALACAIYWTGSFLALCNCLLAPFHHYTIDVEYSILLNWQM